MKLPKGLDCLKNGNWGLKLLSLVLAIVIYYAIKVESASRGHARAEQREAIMNEADMPQYDTTADDNK